MTDPIGPAPLPIGPERSSCPVIRVLHVNSGRLYGGVEVVLEALHCHRTAAVEHDFAVCVEGRSAERLEAAGATVHRIGPARSSRPLSIARTRRTLRSVLRRGGYDVAVVHLAWTQALFGPAVRSVGIPLVSWYHDPTLSRWQPLDAWARRTPPDLMLCNSRYSAGLMAPYYPRVPIEVLSYPVAPPRPRPDGERAATRAALGIADGTTVILQASRWQPHKGQLEHVEALGRLAARPDWVCWMTGAPQQPEEAAYQDQVRTAAKRLGIADRIHFLGWQADLDRLRAAADLYCQPNALHEPFGLAFIEAMYAGLPVLATRMGGPAEMIDPTCGALVEPGDVAGLAGALERLIADPAERARLGTSGPVRAAVLCEPALVMDRLDAILGRAAAARPRPVSGVGRQRLAGAWERPHGRRVVVAGTTPDDLDPSCDPQPDRISVVLPTNGKPQHLREVLDAILGQDHPEIELILVLNGALPEVEAILADYGDRCRVIRNAADVGFAVAVNQGAAAATGRYLYVTANDIVLPPDYLGTLAGVAEADEGWGLLSGVWYDHDEPSRLVGFGGELRFAPTARVTPQTTLRDAARPHDVDWIMGASVFTSRAAWQALGGYREDFFAHYEDIDLCLRVRESGGYVRVVPAARLYHHEHGRGYGNRRIEYHKLRNYAAIHVLHGPAWVWPWLFAKYLVYTVPRVARALGSPGFYVHTVAGTLGGLPGWLRERLTRRRAKSPRLTEALTAHGRRPASV